MKNVMSESYTHTNNIGRCLTWQLSFLIQKFKARGTHSNFKVLLLSYNITFYAKPTKSFNISTLPVLYLPSTSQYQHHAAVTSLPTFHPTQTITTTLPVIFLISTHQDQHHAAVNSLPTFHPTLKITTKQPV